MNNKETEYYTVIRDGEEVKIPASEFYSTGGLTVPSTPFIPTQEDKLKEESIYTQSGDENQGQPSLNAIRPEDSYGDTADIKPVEHERLPTLQILNNQDCAKPWSGLYE